VLLLGSSSLGYSGSACDAWQCAPGRLDARQQDVLHLLVKGAPSVFVLFASPPNAQCLSIPGIGNSLILASPVVPIPITLTSVKIYDTPCGGWFGHGSLSLPAGLPGGTEILLQGVALWIQNWVFSTAIRLRVL
jgi:hypothetical protein